MKYERTTNAMAGLIATALLSLLLAPTFATAQTFTARVPPPQCWPAQVGGTGSKAVRVTNDYGQSIMWWCGQEAVGLVSSWAYTMVIPDKLPANLTDALKLMWEANVTNEPIDEIQRTQLKQDALIALQPLRPTEPRWVVAPNGTFPTRPVYAYLERQAADGTVQRYVDPTTLRVAIKSATGVPTPCDCARTRLDATASSTYCAVPTSALTPVLSINTVARPVAVCRLQ